MVNGLELVHQAACSTRWPSMGSSRSSAPAPARSTPTSTRRWPSSPTPRGTGRHRHRRTWARATAFGTECCGPLEGGRFGQAVRVILSAETSSPLSVQAGFRRRAGGVSPLSSSPGLERRQGADAPRSPKLGDRYPKDISACRLMIISATRAATSSRRSSRSRPTPQTVCPACHGGEAPPQDRPRRRRHPVQRLGLLSDRLPQRQRTRSRAKEDKSHRPPAGAVRSPRFQAHRVVVEARRARRRSSSSERDLLDMIRGKLPDLQASGYEIASLDDAAPASRSARTAASSSTLADGLDGTIMLIPGRGSSLPPRKPEPEE